MKSGELRVSDLYEGAFLLCGGCELKELTLLDQRGRPSVTFVIRGDGVEAKSAAYRQGRATANVALLKFTMEKLKDEMFAKIRENQRTGRRGSHDRRGIEKSH